MAFEPNASLPAPSLEECAEFEDRARKMLRRAWDNPKELGEDSAICADATALLSEIRQFCSPQDEPDKPNPARENFHDALKLAWLAVWRARDYSARALARRSANNKWPNHFEYQSVRARLVSFGGVDWFPHHHPLFDRDGNPIDRPKLDFARYFSVQNSREFQEGAMVSNSDQLLADPKVPLEWVYILSALPDRSTAMACEHCFLDVESKAISCGDKKLSPVRNSIAMAPVEISSFKNSSFGMLKGSRFEAGLRLQGELVDEFTGATIEVGGNLVFRNSQLKAGVDLRSAGGIRSFSTYDTTISGDLSIGGRTKLAIRLEKASVGAILAEKCILDSLYVVDLQIQGEVRLSGTSIEKRTQFSNVDFNGNCDFRTDFVGSKRTGERFRSPDHSTWFRNCRFRQAVIFEGARCNDITFEDSSFAKGASFRSVSFRERADFRKTSWGGAADFSAGLTGPTRFFSNFDISHTDLNEVGAKFQRCLFTDTRFDGRVVFQNRKFMDETWFDRAIFKSAPEFHGSKLHSKTFFSGTRFTWSQGRASAWHERAFSARFLHWLGLPLPDKTANDARRLLDVVNCFRVLTSLANDIDAKDLAYRFHKEELRAKYRLPLANGVSRSEAFVGRVYGLLADYGDSFIRPLAWLVVSILGFALTYASPFLANEGRWNASVATSAALQFRPVAALDPGFGRLPSIEAENLCKANVASKGSITTECMQYHLRRDHELSVKAASIGQTLLSFVFLFLTLLALRRKYQVS